MAKKSDSIGVATMADDGTLHLLLRAEDPGGAVGDATFKYAPGDDHYQEMVDHLGGIRPGEQKPVPPWKQKSGGK
jgi:hypothetical protein